MHPATELPIINASQTVSKNGQNCDSFAVGQQPCTVQISSRLNFVQNLYFPW